MLDKSNSMFGPLLKLERADYHIKELRTIFRHHINTHVKPAMAKNHRNEWQQRVAQIPTRLPLHTPTIIGDAIHNLRVSLDHAYWIAVERAGGVWSKRIKFPFGEDRISIEASIRGQKMTDRPSTKIVEYILDTLQPYKGGELNLYDLHTLDILDKHQVLVPTQVAFGSKKGGTLIFANGQRLVFEAGSRIVASSAMCAEGQAFISAGEDGGAIKYTGNLQDAVQILFGPGPFERRPVMDTLRQIRNDVHTAIIGFSDRL